MGFPVWANRELGESSRLVGELLGAAQPGEDLERRLLGDLAYRSEQLERAGGGGNLLGDRALPSARQ